MAQNRNYEDFQPAHDWGRDEQSDTLILHLPGFTRSQLKVQITSTRKIRVSGERQVEGNKWRRFYIEFPAPQDSDTNDIGAKFEKGILYVKFPKLIAPQQPPTTQQAPPPPKPEKREEWKSEEALEKKAETKMEQKEKEAPTEKNEKENGISSGGEKLEEEAYTKVTAKAIAQETEDRGKQVEESRRAETFTDRLSSMQAQDYRDAIVGLVGELKKQKDVITKLVFVFLVLLLGLYLKHLVTSFFGGSNKSHHEL